MALSDKDMNALDKLWEKFTSDDKVEEDKEGKYITLDNSLIEREGFNIPDYNTPGTMQSFQKDTGMTHTYFRKAAGGNKTKIFKRNIKSG